MKVRVDAMKKQAGKAHRLLASMANEKRLLILCQLIDGERSVNEIAELLGARQSTISQHLALLRKDGFVAARREGQTQFYALKGDDARSVIETLYTLYCVPASRKK